MWIGARQLIVFLRGPLKILLPFRSAAKFQPGGSGHALAAGIQVLAKILPSGIDVLRFQVHLAKFDDRLVVLRDVILPPLDLSQDRPAINPPETAPPLCL